MVVVADLLVLVVVRPVVTFEDSKICKVPPTHLADLVDEVNKAREEMGGEREMCVCVCVCVCVCWKTTQQTSTHTYIGMHIDATILSSSFFPPPIPGRFQ